MSSILRSYKRNRAKVNMKQIGMRQICKGNTFSENWRKLSGGVVTKKKKEDK